MMSMPPKWSSAALTIRVPKSGAVTSPRQLMASPPRARIFAMVSSAGPASRSFTTTLAPSLASFCAMACPMPRPEPVTIAIFPSSFFILFPHKKIVSKNSFASLAVVAVRLAGDDALLLEFNAVGIGAAHLPQYPPGILPVSGGEVQFGRSPRHVHRHRLHAPASAAWLACGGGFAVYRRHCAHRGDVVDRRVRNRRFAEVRGDLCRDELAGHGRHLAVYRVALAPAAFVGDPHRIGERR